MSPSSGRCCYTAVTMECYCVCFRGQCQCPRQVAAVVTLRSLWSVDCVCFRGQCPRQVAAVVTLWSLWSIIVCVPEDSVSVPVKWPLLLHCGHYGVLLCVFQRTVSVSPSSGRCCYTAVTMECYCVCFRGQCQCPRQVAAVVTLLSLWSVIVCVSEDSVSVPIKWPLLLHCGHYGVLLRVFQRTVSVSPSSGRCCYTAVTMECYCVCFRGQCQCPRQVAAVVTMRSLWSVIVCVSEDSVSVPVKWPLLLHCGHYGVLLCVFQRTVSVSPSSGRCCYTAVTMECYCVCFRGQCQCPVKWPLLLHCGHYGVLLCVFQRTVSVSPSSGRCCYTAVTMECYCVCFRGQCQCPVKWPLLLHCGHYGVLLCVFQRTVSVSPSSGRCCYTAVTMEYYCVCFRGQCQCPHQVAAVVTLRSLWSVIVCVSEDSVSVPSSGRCCYTAVTMECYCVCFRGQCQCPRQVAAVVTLRSLIL